MRRSVPQLFLAVSAGLCLFASAAFAAKHKGKSDQDSQASGNDKTMDSQMAWEKKVMGEDSTKKAEMKRITAAQKLADEARKNPPPEPAPKVKDPNKEGVRAKQEASIGLPTDADQKNHASKKTTVASAKKQDKPSSSANDELGALVASSLAEDRSTKAPTKTASASDASSGSSKKGRVVKGRKGRSTQAAAPSEPSSLDKMFANANK